MDAIIQFIPQIVTTIATVFIAYFAYSQLVKINKQLEQNNEQLKLNNQKLENEHAWNRRHAAKETMDAFLSEDIYESWRALKQPVAVENKSYEDLSKNEQDKAIRLVSFFENVGVLIENFVIDEMLISKSLRGPWQSLFQCTCKHISTIRSNRKAMSVYEHFVNQAVSFHNMDLEYIEIAKKMKADTELERETVAEKAKENSKGTHGPTGKTTSD